MKKALILFGSTTGNTEDMAGMIKRALEASGLETELKDVASAVPGDLNATYDLLMVGCPAYGDDAIELQEDFQEYYEQIDGVSLNGKKYAVFAPGDSSYTFFCGSVDMLEDKLEDLGGQRIAAGLKIDGDPSDAEKEIEEWARAVAADLE